MLSPQVSPQYNLPIVFGGNDCRALKSWLRELGIGTYIHAELTHDNIGLLDMQLSAAYLAKEYGFYKYIFSVGLYADKILHMAGIDHGSLPLTAKHEALELSDKMLQCRNYLIRSGYASASISSSGPMQTS